MTEDAPECPPEVAEYAGQTVVYVERALGLRLEYDSDTLSVLDHYLRGVPADRPETIALVAVTAGAYFGEVVRHHIGGRWELGAGKPEGWRFILPTGISFSPIQHAAAAMTKGQGSADEETAALVIPELIRPMLEDALAAMAEVSEETYFSLCGRLDTLEHLHEVVAACAAQEIARKAAAEPGPLEN